MIGFRSISAIPPEAPSGEHGGGRVQACLSGLACLPGLVDTEYHKVAARDPAIDAADDGKAAAVVAASLAALKRARRYAFPASMIRP